ncbi:glycosyltransferase family 2 protein [Massilia sp.]|uniref:glycosyltransferase family 2 protein n=1 Tax=Massilia sp. TaxID=1882437 RepID=UPI0028992DD7|nr:glycosyltransferase family 2 protein [Massilia sp.]
MSAAHEAVVDVLLPTCDRPAALAVALGALAASSGPRLRIVVSDQSEAAAACEAPEVRAVLRYLRARGVDVDIGRHLPRRGMAEQRAFLLAQARAPWCLFLDDDVIVEPDLVARLHAALVEQGCGFVGSAVHGLSYLGQLRPAQEQVEFWDGRVEPETVRPGTPAWARHHLHSAANLFHVQSRLRDGRTRLYRVAWIGGCVLFDTAKLRAAGGFEFWRQLPEAHCGEDVLAQLRVMERYGGCGILPSGAYHMELPTTVDRREVDAPYFLPHFLLGPASDVHGERDAAAVRDTHAMDGNGEGHR